MRRRAYVYWPRPMTKMNACIYLRSLLARLSCRSELHGGCAAPSCRGRRRRQLRSICASKQFIIIVIAMVIIIFIILIIVIIIIMTMMILISIVMFTIINKS